MTRLMQTNPLKILVVEDNQGDFLLLKENIQLAKIIVGELQLAGTLSEAKDYLQHNKPDIVFLDLYLPDSSGLESFSQLKDDMAASAVIVLSGLSDTKAALEAITLGAQDYLAKGEFDEKLLEKTMAYSMERKRNVETLRERQRAITEATIKGQENEREQLGLELHDNINQILATARLYLDFATSEGSIKKEFVLKSKGYISDAIEEIRRLSKALLPPTLEEFGLMMAMDELTDSLSLTGNFRIEKKWCDFREQGLQKDQKLTIYRIVQEQLNNIIKHACAKTVTVFLHQHEEVGNSIVELLIKDDGKGFDPAQRRNGVGLRNICSRAELFGGTVTIQSKPGQGCELKVIFPGDHTD
jgi:signal transduction histidine kinase